MRAEYVPRTHAAPVVTTYTTGDGRRNAMLTTRNAFGIAFALFVVLALAYAAHALPHATTRGPHGAYRYDVVVRCSRPIAEDSAAHVRLARYALTPDGSARIVYACTRKGY